MYKINYYADNRGEMPVKKYIDGLAGKTDKNSRVKLNKILDYIDALAEHGQSLSRTYMKHIEGDIWELRPIRERIFFVAWNGDGFLLLHHFIKKSQRTPQKEIETAKRRYMDAITQETEEKTEGKDDEK